jgi:hypothetical protein
VRPSQVQLSVPGMFFHGSQVQPRPEVPAFGNCLVNQAKIVLQAHHFMWLPVRLHLYNTQGIKVGNVG